MQQASQKINYKGMIEKYFQILDYKQQRPVEFRFNNVQTLFYDILMTEYGDMEGVREIILKARREGMSSFILALFTVDFLLKPYSVSVCITHKRDVTELLFKQVKFYLQTFVDKKNEERKLANKSPIQLRDILGTETKGMIENKLNKAMFYIGTAGSKVGGRGSYATNIHFSEAAFYQDTELITASEMITATAQQVPLGKGKIFIESTANGEGNYYHGEWQRAYVDKVSTYQPRFFGWELFYTEADVLERKKDFATESMWKQEYPRTPEDAFRASGSPFFDMNMLQTMFDKKSKPVVSGRFAPDGEFI